MGSNFLQLQSCICPIFTKTRLHGHSSIYKAYPLPDFLFLFADKASFLLNMPISTDEVASAWNSRISVHTTTTAALDALDRTMQPAQSFLWWDGNSVGIIFSTFMEHGGLQDVDTLSTPGAVTGVAQVEDVHSICHCVCFASLTDTEVDGL